MPCQQWFFEPERKINALSGFIQGQDAILHIHKRASDSRSITRRSPMTHKSSLTKTTAIVLAASVFAGGLLPVAQASAGHKQRAHAHQGGHYGYRQKPRRHQPRHVQRKRNNNGDLVAAGVIGLALGAIIASEANRNKQPRYDAYRQPAPQPTYQYDNYGQRVPLDYYQAPAQQAPRYNQPEVITYEDSVSLEPWTPGWREWCSNRYRSFNAQTGTFRGYDGFDHFCVPK